MCVAFGVVFVGGGVLLIQKARRFFFFFKPIDTLICFKCFLTCVFTNFIKHNHILKRTQSTHNKHTILIIKATIAKQQQTIRIAATKAIKADDRITAIVAQTERARKSLLTTKHCNQARQDTHKKQQQQQQQQQQQIDSRVAQARKRRQIGDASAQARTDQGMQQRKRKRD